ncbi:MAG TPA: YjbH domain-containing protein [Paracoccaceae bacterium]|nr:YjbH domain-containing protein [Paracoccaceae bacterium]
MKLAKSGCRVISRAPLRDRFPGRASFGCLALFALCAQPLLAQDNAAPALFPDHGDMPGFNMNGAPGIVEMPSAMMAPDATLSGSLSRIGGITRGTVTFQITPRLSGSFRYAALDGLTRLRGQTVPGLDGGTYYDRSFDLRYQVLREGRYRPAVTIGLLDFAGTSLYGAEYVVASKSLTPRVRVTGGLGWGRLGGRNAIASTGTRSTELLEQGGVPSYDRWFRGDMAAFGGVEWAVNDRLTLKAEYSSDNFAEEAANGLLTPKTGWNFGLDYRIAEGVQASVLALQGAAIGAQITVHTNPRSTGTPGGTETAPAPVYRRSAAERRDLGWQQEPAQRDALPGQLAQALARERMVMDGLTLTDDRALLRLINPVHASEPQAIGRSARIMARVLPGSIDTFVIVPVVNGMAMSAITLRRADLENLEHAPASALLEVTRIEDAATVARIPVTDRPAALTWSFGPNLRYSLFDPDNPFRADLLATARADLLIAPGLVLSGAMSKRLVGNLDSISRRDASALPRVRTDYGLYAQQGDPSIDHLTLTHYMRPGRDLYARVSAGYLEQMYAGLSAELLWKPVDSRLALGIEINQVRQRDFDQLFGLRDYEVTTGHASAYYDLGRGFHGQLDVGRYLAGDVGATISLDREFTNGWRLGAFATLTDVTPEDFGEGSFDKGFRITVPLGHVLGQPSRRLGNVTVRPLTRDGGARLDLRDRLYEQVRDYHRPELEKKWGRVWR